MAKQDKKKEHSKRTPPPVVTGCDKRAENRAQNHSGDKDSPQPTHAPDGVSGNWS